MLDNDRLADESEHIVEELGHRAWSLIWHHVLPLFLKLRTYKAIALILLSLSPVMMWRYGFTPAVPPTVAVVSNAPVGTTTVLALRNLIKDDLYGVDESFISRWVLPSRWVANDLPWPRWLLLYKSSFQVGEWNAWQQVTYNLKFHLSREGRSDRIDRNLIKANSAINNSAENFWFPSAESKMKEAVAALDAYLAKLPTKQNFYPRANTLYGLIDGFASSLGGSMADLTDNPDIGYFQGYGPFYYAKGQVYVVVTMLKAIQIDFADILATKHGSEKQIADAIHWLEQALLVRPWIYPSNGELGLTNDLSTLANRISKAQQILGPLADTLRNG